MLSRTLLTRAECKAVGDEQAEGWQAHHAHDPFADEEPLVVYYCPVCAEREFGEGLQNPERAKEQESTPEHGAATEAAPPTAPVGEFKPPLDCEPRGRA